MGNPLLRVGGEGRRRGGGSGIIRWALVQDTGDREKNGAKAKHQ